MLDDGRFRTHISRCPRRREFAPHRFLRRASSAGSLFRRQFLDDGHGAAARRLGRLDDLAGRPLRSDASIFAGTPAELADQLVAWRRHGLDGFRLRPGVIGHDLEAIVDGLVPELQQRDVFHRAYEAGMFRERLGLGRPPSRYAAASAGAATGGAA